MLSDEFTNQRQGYEIRSILEPGLQNLQIDDDYQKSSSFVDDLVEDSSLQFHEERKGNNKGSHLKQVDHLIKGSQQIDAGKLIFVCSKLIKCQNNVFIIKLQL